MCESCQQDERYFNSQNNSLNINMSEDEDLDGH